MNPLKRMLLAAYNPAMHFYRRRLRRLSHQRLDMERTLAKWPLIEKELTGPPGSLLDIGCNEGFFTRKAAEKGWCAWGIDRLANPVEYAANRAREQGLPTVFFAHGLMTPEAACGLPTFDVILLVSTFHEIFNACGEARAYQLFDDLLKACRRKLIFEPASTNDRYSREKPVLARDNDRDAVETWVRALVSRSPGWRTRYVGETRYTNAEPHRFMFVIERMN